MARQPVFYSFHYDNDVFRVQQIRQMGMVDGNEPVAKNEWEQLRRKGPVAIQNWIDATMKYKRCVVVLVGSDTATRPWVQYEIKKAWVDNRGLLGVYIHNLKCLRTGKSRQGLNPFEQFKVAEKRLSSLVQCYDPNSYDAYGDISRNLPSLIDSAIAMAKYR